MAHQSFRSTADPTFAQKAFSARLATLAEAHAVLVSQNWQQARLVDIANAAISPFQKEGNISRTYAGGADMIGLKPQSAISFAMILHELCTNAAKYGALSVDAGGSSSTGAAEHGANSNHASKWWKSVAVPRSNRRSAKDSGRD